MQLYDLIAACRSAHHDKRWVPDFQGLESGHKAHVRGKLINDGPWHTIIDEDDKLRAVKCDMLSVLEKDAQ